MLRSSDRFCTTHAGALPLPPALSAVEQPAEAELEHAVRGIVEQQVIAGIDVVGNGALRPELVTDRLDGFAPDDSTAPDPADLVEFSIQATSDAPRYACVGPVSLRHGSPLRRDVSALERAIAAHPTAQAFVSLPSPGLIALWHPNHHYATYEQYVAALAEAMRPEYVAAQRSGILLQLDCSDLALGRHLFYAGASLEEFRRVAWLHVEALNHAVSGIPPGRMRLLVSWGDYAGPHHRDVPLGDIIDLLSRARPGGLVIPLANPRHEHEWRVFEQPLTPESKVLIAGVVDTSSSQLEHPEVVADRIWRLAKLVGVNRLIAGTDGGLASRGIEPAIAWAKLRVLAEGASRASERFAPVRRSPARPTIASTRAEEAPAAPSSQLRR